MSGMDLGTEMVSLWIDDVRPEPEGWVWVKTAPEAIAWLEQNGNGAEKIEVISFDHDLGFAYMDSSTAIDGGGQPDNDKFSDSKPVLIWMIENDVWPDEIRVHSHNWWGAEWLSGTAKRYAPEHVKVSTKRYVGEAGCTCA